MQPNRLNLEWLVISALRENLSLIQENFQPTYNDTIRFAKESFGELFQQPQSPFGNKGIVNPEYLKYMQEAKAISQKDKITMKPEDLIIQRINRIEGLLQAPANRKESLNKLKREKERLIKLLKENKSKITRINETNALKNDSGQFRPGLEYIRPFAGKYDVYKTNTGDQFILRFLHPSAAEAATGVDLIYEIYNHHLKKFRIVAIQYKIWKNSTLYFSSIPNLGRQIAQCENSFCKTGYCRANHTEFIFRFPYCIPFLRPTDEIYNENHMITSGWHLPICQIPDCLDYSGSTKGILRLENIKNVALNQDEFEKLFQQEKIGSKWLTIEEVENFYKLNKVLNDDENITIYSQKSIN